jgi:hypothetical protein
MVDWSVLRRFILFRGVEERRARTSFVMASSGVIEKRYVIPARLHVSNQNQTE